MINAAPSTDRPSPDAPNKWRLPAIDGLRAVAMLMVVGCHVFAFSGNPAMPVGVFGRVVDAGRIFPQLPSGVDLFMVLSGFCLFLPVCKSRGAVENWHWRDFYARRVRRIVPPYYAAIAYAVLLPFVLVGVYHALHQPARWPRLDSASVYVAHLLFLQTLIPGAFGHVNAAFWSLALEAQFYLVFPLVVLGFRRYGIRFLAAMILVSVAYRIGASVVTHQMGYEAKYLSSVFFLGRWMQFAFGMGAALYVAAHRRRDQWRSARWGTWVLLSSVALFVATCATCPDLAWIRSLLLGAAFAGMIVALCVSTTGLRILVENRTIAWLGFISFSIFLRHWPTLYYLSELLKRVLRLHGLPEFLALSTLGFALVVGISFAFFLVFERPFMNIPPRLPPAAEKITEPAEKELVTQ